MTRKIWYWDRESYQAYQKRMANAYRNLYVQVKPDGTVVDSPCSNMEEEDAPQEYPLNTAMAACELRRRGIDCIATQLEYLAKKEIFKPASGSDGHLEWSAEMIDQIAEFFDEQESLTPYGQMCFAMNISFGQMRHAILDACEKMGRSAFLSKDPTQFKMVIYPAKNVADDYARVEFFPPDAEV